MSAPEPSPLPWHDDDGFIKDATGKIVDMRAVNRLLIIPAVNSHDVLLAAAVAVIERYDQLYSEMSEVLNLSVELGDLRKAIANAEERAS